MDYRNLYFALFNSLTDAIELIDSGNAEAAKSVLVEAQQKAEDMFIENEE